MLHSWSHFMFMLILPTQSRGQGLSPPYMQPLHHTLWLLPKNTCVNVSFKNVSQTSRGFTNRTVHVKTSVFEPSTRRGTPHGVSRDCSVQERIFHFADQLIEDRVLVPLISTTLILIFETKQECFTKIGQGTLSLAEEQQRHRNSNWR